MKERLVVAAPPFMRDKIDTKRAMRLVIIVLLPILIYSVYLFGWRVLLITLLSITTCLICEAVMQKILDRKIAIVDCSAILTGLLLAFNLPPGVPWWLPVIGSGFAMIFVKQLFGGLGYNFINPALAGRAFLMASWPAFMTTGWLNPTGGTLSGIDSVTGATPLTLLKNPAYYADPNIVSRFNEITAIKNLFFGKVGGCIGETPAFLLLMAGIFLIFINIIDYRIVVGYLLSFGLLASIIPTQVNLLFHLFSGGLLLGAFFMAPDWVTSPVTKNGRWFYGIGCGILTIVIRTWGGFPEGVCYAILLMNVFTPLIDHLTKPKIYGEGRLFMGVRKNE